MRGKKHRGAAGARRGDRARNALAGRGVEPLGRLVEQEQPRPAKYQLLKREQLLLAAGEIVRVTVGRVRKSELRERRVDLSRAVAGAARPLGKLLAHRLAGKYRLRRLRQERLGGRERVLHAALLRLGHAGEHREQGRLSAAVAAHERADLSLNELQVKATKHPAAVAPVPEPRLMHAHRLGSGRGGRPLVHGDAASDHNLRNRRLAYLSPVDDERARRVLGHRLRRVRGNHDRDAKLAVRPEEQPQERLLRDGVEHARGLVEQQQARAHGERGRQGKRLPLTTGELGRLRAEPRLHAEEIAGLGHATAHLCLGNAEVFEAEGHLMPHRVAHNLRVGALEHVADGARRGDRREPRDVLAKDADRPRKLPRRPDLWLGQAEQGRLTRPRGTAQQRERPFRHREPHAVEHARAAARVPEAHRVELKRRAHSNPLQRSRSAAAAPAGKNINAA